jgi:hypothetical protein
VLQTAVLAYENVIITTTTTIIILQYIGHS